MTSGNKPQPELTMIEINDNICVTRGQKVDICFDGIPRGGRCLHEKYNIEESLLPSGVITFTGFLVITYCFRILHSAFSFTSVSSS